MGSGKSTVARLLREKGIVVLDADQIARDVIGVGSEYYGDTKQKLLAAFGPLSAEPLFDETGALRRGALAALVFGDKKRTAMLGEIMHPPIQAEFARQVGKLPQNQLIVYDVPLLFEGGLDAKVRGSILVYAPENTCIERAVARATAQGQVLSVEDARARLNQQISIEKKRELADYIIDNSGDLAQLKQQITGLCQKLG